MTTAICPQGIADEIHSKSSYRKDTYGASKCNFHSSPRSRKNFQKKHSQKHCVKSQKRCVKWGSGGSPYPCNRSPPKGRKYPYNNNFHSRSSRDVTKMWEFSRLKLDLSIEDFVLIMAEMLEEKNKFLINEIVKCLGKDKVVGLMRTTKAVQALGGLDLPATPGKGKNGMRTRRTKRTVGGVFIQLAKNAIPTEQWKTINHRSEKNKPKKKKPRHYTNTTTPRKTATTRILFGTVSSLDLEENSDGRVNPDLEFQKTSPNQIQPSNTASQSQETTKQKSLNENKFSEVLYPQNHNEQSKNTGLSQSTMENQEKNRIGELLYPKIEQEQPHLAPKITGMLLDAMDNQSLSNLINYPEQLREAITEALKVWKDGHELIGDELYKRVCAKVLKQFNIPGQFVAPNAQGQRLAKKITGMLLEMDQDRLFEGITDKNPAAIEAWIENAIEILREEERSLGNQLFPFVQEYTSSHPIKIAQKVTGMLLDGMDPEELSSLLRDSSTLKEKVADCLSVLGIKEQISDCLLVRNFVSSRSSTRNHHTR